MKNQTPRFKKSEFKEAFLKAFQCEGRKARSLSDEAKGYLELDMPDFAVSVLDRAVASPSGGGAMEALGLLAHEQNGMSASDLAERAVHLLSLYPDNVRILEMAILYLCTNEKYAEVLQLEERYRDSGTLDGNDFHTIACAAAQRGEYSRALQFAVSAVSDIWCPGNLITDCQLLPLWQHYAGTVPDKEEAVLLVSPELEEALDEAVHSEVTCSVCEYTVRRILPEKFRPWMRRMITSHFEVAPAAPREITRDFRYWLEEIRKRNIRLVRRAIQRGVEKLEATPVEALINTKERSKE